ncbi:MAG: zeta toxin family protein [Verrucomicrobiota bacterium]
MKSCYINADLIASGLSPLAPEKVKIQAGRLMLKRIEESVSKSESFAFESTLSGTTYIKRIKDWKKQGYEVIMFYLKLPSVEMAVDRVKNRVSEGGHNIPEADIRRRFDRSWKNFNEIYGEIVDTWLVFDTSEEIPKLIEKSD